MAIELILYPYHEAKVVRLIESQNDSLGFVLVATGIRVQARSPQSSYTSVYFHEDDLALVESLLLTLEE